MKVALVVQRYGMEICGGSEQLCRQVAERLSRHCQVEVLTTCALDYMSWRDVYEPGPSVVNGVLVRRFRVDYPRTVPLFNHLCEAVFSERTCPELEQRWVREQGPYSSDFLRFLETERKCYDAFIFFTYAYGFTFFGLPRVAQRSLLVPTAHDEPAFHLSIYRSLFRQPRALIFNTAEEQNLVLKKFYLKTSSTVIGMGMEEIDPRNSPQVLAGPFDRVRRPFLLYLGRIDEAKGCHSLFDHFIRFRREHPQTSLQLVLAGKALMEIPTHPDIVALGFLDEEAKRQVLAAATLLIMPSPYESLSIVVLEAWSVAVPVLVNGQCAVLRGQCRRSGGGLTYTNYDSFAKAVSQLLQEPTLARELGERGRQFVREHYAWPVVERKYLEWVEWVCRQAA
ncbi:MAG TPA: glycosyltransferase family 4 protein [Gemmataceae bacterium]|nr:glycosyltransferase family 4 protein [Gemmataceae bacterium]